MSHVHGEILSKLVERGPVEGLLNLSETGTNVVKLATFVHEVPDKVLNFLLSHVPEGKLRRETIHEFENDCPGTPGESHVVVYWQHYQGNGRHFVEYLLDMNITSSADYSNHTIELRQADENNLPEEALMKLSTALESASQKNVKRAVVKGEIKLVASEFGQSALTFAGSVIIETRTIEAEEGEKKGKRQRAKEGSHKLFKTMKNKLAGLQLTSVGKTIDPGKAGEAKKKGKRQRAKEGSQRALRRIQNMMSGVHRSPSSVKFNTSAMSSSFTEILGEVAKQFRQPDVVDERIQNHFIDEVMPTAPQLTIAEEDMLGRLKILQSTLLDQGKRIKSSLKEDVEKFLWREGGRVWAAYDMTVDNSAKRLLAHVLQFDTYEESALHKKSKSGQLTRVIRKNVDGTRGLIFRIGLHVPTVTNRLIEVWQTWKEEKSRHDQVSYIVGFVPMNDYQGSGFQDLSKDGYVLGETTGIYVIKEIAPYVCRVMRIQTVDLKASLPAAAINYIAEYKLTQANAMQERFRRNGNEVDKEVRAVLVKRMKEGVELDPGQKKVFEEVETLFGENGGGWEKLESPNVGVELQIKKKDQTGKSMSVAWGRAEAIADCTAEEAAAWYFGYCSRERVALDREKGNPAKLEIKKGMEKVNERMVASVKKMPFPLHNREFVGRIVWSRISNTTMALALVPVRDYRVDYGGGMGNLISGQTHAIFTSTNIESVGGVPQCKIEILQSFDAGGRVPVRLMNSKVPESVGIVGVMTNSFNKGDEIDKAEIASIAKIIKNEPQDYSDDENEAIRKGKELYNKCKEDKHFNKIESLDDRVKMKLVHVDGEGLVTGVATTVVDASVAECAACQFYVGSRELMRTKLKEHQNIIDYHIVPSNNHTKYIVQTRKLHHLLSEREWRNKMTWKCEEGDRVVIDVADTKDIIEDHPKKHGTIMSSAHAVWVFEPMKAVGEIQQTAVTFTIRANIGGSIPASIVNGIVPQFLSIVSNMREKFDKSKEIDNSNRLQLVKKMGNLQRQRAAVFTERFEDVEKARKVKDGLSTAQILMKEKGKGKGWGRIVLNVRAELNDTAAFFWDIKSRASTILGVNVAVVDDSEEKPFERTIKQFELLDGQLTGLHSVRRFSSKEKLIKTGRKSLVIATDPLNEEGKKIHEKFRKRERQE